MLPTWSSSNSAVLLLALVAAANLDTTEARPHHRKCRPSASAVSPVATASIPTVYYPPATATYPAASVTAAPAALTSSSDYGHIQPVPIPKPTIVVKQQSSAAPVGKATIAVIPKPAATPIVVPAPAVKPAPTLAEKTKAAAEKAKAAAEAAAAKAKADAQAVAARAKADAQAVAAKAKADAAAAAAKAKADLAAAAAKAKADAAAAAAKAKGDAQQVVSAVGAFVGSQSGIGSWFRASSGQDSTNGNSWCGYPYTDDTPGFAPDVWRMAGTGNDPMYGNPNWAPIATKYCGLEAEVTDPSTGITKILYIVDAFDHQYVRSPGSIDIMTKAWESLTSQDANDKDIVIKGVQWKLTGKRNPKYAFKGPGDR
ncbi:hypothetical protein HKX48_006178 [Thoreauomyces humboldtii]|nr:hypothetical protein HKX48_006178 [Thoreauomyces humboldtii]